MLFPLIKAGEEAELGEVYFYGGYERPGVDIAGPWSIDFPLEHHPSAVLDWTGTLAGRRVDHVTVSPLTVTMDSNDTGGFHTAELTVVLKDGTEVPAACGPGRYANLGEGVGVEVWDAYNTWSWSARWRWRRSTICSFWGSTFRCRSSGICQNGYPTGSFAGGISVCF